MRKTIKQSVVESMNESGYVMFASTTGTPTKRKGSNCWKAIEISGIPLENVVIKTAAKMRRRSEGYQCLLFVKAPTLD